MATPKPAIRTTLAQKTTTNQ
ncbi:hypothetical protein E2C01_088457 [Portunus trituberculatus]|uniref:Uncharacterized protein n=1 Tax=Portunus trituberculatus TaxID=210409 RepID=A0A5B7JG21_PORTR|nr:hypothetical protein [Portunus trituberculatus]